MSFSVLLAGKEQAEAQMQERGVSPRKALEGSVLAVSVGSVPEAASFRGEQMNVEMLLKSSFIDTNRSKKKVMTPVEGKVLGVEQDAAGKPVTAYLEASSGMIKALANSQIVNFSRADELSRELKTLSPASKRGGGHAA